MAILHTWKQMRWRWESELLFICSVPFLTSEVFITSFPAWRNALSLLLAAPDTRSQMSLPDWHSEYSRKVKVNPIASVRVFSLPGVAWPPRTLALSDLLTNAFLCGWSWWNCCKIRWPPLSVICSVCSHRVTHKMYVRVVSPPASNKTCFEWKRNN